MPLHRAWTTAKARPTSSRYTVTDGSLTSTTTLTITVTGVNDGPVAVDDSAVTPEDTPVIVPVLANDIDVDGDPLTVTQVNGQPINANTPVDLFDTAPTPNKIGTVTLNPDGTLTFTPVPLFNGPVNFDYTVSDGTATDIGTVNIVVDNVNDPPDARDDVIRFTEDTVTAFDPRSNDIDVDGDQLTITAVNGSPISLGSPPIQLANGTIQMVVGNTPGTTQLSFTPNPNFNGTQTFTYTISDGRGGTDTATVTLQGIPVNDPPAGKDAVETTPEDTPYTVTVANFGFSDPDVGDTFAAVRIDTLPGQRQPAVERHAGARRRTRDGRADRRRRAEVRSRTGRERLAVRQLHLLGAGFRRCLRPDAQHPDA